MKNLKNKPLIAGSSGSLWAGSIIAGLIGFSPYIFYIYEIFPDGPIWENSYIRYESKYYQSVAVAAWTYLGKVMPLFLLLIWFLTCKHWWYHAILIPIVMYFYQIIVAFYQDFYMESIYLDVNGLVFLFPFFTIILIMVYFVRIKVFDRIYGIDLSEIERGSSSISLFNSTTKKEEEIMDSMEKSLRYEGNMPKEKDEDYYERL